ncbi:MAG: hypothetical protein IKU34_12325 [Clostridia bacterium]|nr:hypothetical protein [Clostridia bacterium]
MEEDKTPEALNRLAREQMKKKILNDIMVDLTVCDVEGWDKREYIRELHELIDSLAPDGRTANA